MISRHRPATPIFAVTTHPETRRRLALVWGIESALIHKTVTTDELIAASLDAAQKKGVVTMDRLFYADAKVMVSDFRARASPGPPQTPPQEYPRADRGPQGAAGGYRHRSAQRTAS